MRKVPAMDGSIMKRRDKSAERMIMEDEDRGGSKREAALALDAMPTKGNKMLRLEKKDHR